MIFSSFMDNYNPHQRNITGESLLTKLFTEICNATDLELTMPYQCKGFRIYNKHRFHVLNEDNWEIAFQLNKADQFMELLQKSAVVNIENTLTSDMYVNVKDNVGLNVLAQKYCPKIFETVQHDEVW